MQIVNNYSKVVLGSLYTNDRGELAIMGRTITNQYSLINIETGSIRYLLRDKDTMDEILDFYK